VVVVVVGAKEDFYSFCTDSSLYTCTNLSCFPNLGNSKDADIGDHLRSKFVRCVYV